MLIKGRGWATHPMFTLLSPMRRANVRSLTNTEIPSTVSPRDVRNRADILSIFFPVGKQTLIRLAHSRMVLFLILVYP